MQYKEFKLGDLFNVLSSKHNYHANQVKIYNTHTKEAYPYVVRSAISNGVRGYLKEDNKHLNSGNTISFAQDTFIAFYQMQPYFTGNKVKILSPKKETVLNEHTGLFIATTINKSMATLSWGTGSDIDMITNISIKLPVTPEGEPDFDYMADYIKQIQADHIKQIQAYIELAGKDNPYLNGGGTATA